MVNWDQAITTIEESVGKPAFWIAFVLVALFAMNRFAVSNTEPDEFDPPVVPRSFTTRFRYYLSAVAYIACYEFAFVLLVSIGSFPSLEAILKEWIGTTAFRDLQGHGIGTPAWAALFVTTILPAAPGFKTGDDVVRRKLHKFASIPHKARALGREILEHLGKLSDETTQASSNKPSELDKMFSNLTWLEGAFAKLQNTDKNPDDADSYQKFFKKYEGVVERIRGKKRTLEESLNAAEAQVPLVKEQLDNALHFSARFLSCALLQTESSQRDVRTTVRDFLALKTLPVLEFDYNLKQIILNTFAVLALTFVVGLATLAAVLPRVGDLSGNMIVFVARWVPYSAFMLVPSFIFAAGVQLYFMDRRQNRARPAQFEDKLLALILLALLTYGVGTLPPVIGMAWRQHIEHAVGGPWIMQMLPFGLTPALAALIFYWLASRRLVQSRFLEITLDFMVFALVAGIGTWFSTVLAIKAGLSIPDMSGVPAFTKEIALWVFPITSAALLGIVGALQCRISRSVIVLEARRA